MTNENSSFTDQTSRNLARTLAALIVILTCACLVLGGRAWFNEQQKYLAAERKQAVLVKLQEISQTRLLLCRISAGKRDEVIQALNLKLSNDLRELNSSPASVDEDTRGLTRIVCEAVARARMKYSVYGLTNTASIDYNGISPHQLLHAEQPNPPARFVQQ